jgi:hypothetical protein
MYPHYLCLVAADPALEQHADANDDDRDANRPMDSSFDEALNFADQGL